MKRLVRVTTVIVLNDGMDEGLLSVAAALAMQGFNEGDVEVRSLEVTDEGEAS